MKSTGGRTKPIEAAIGLKYLQRIDLGRFCRDGAAAVFVLNQHEISGVLRTDVDPGNPSYACCISILRGLGCALGPSLTGEWPRGGARSRVLLPLSAYHVGMEAWETACFSLAVRPTLPDHDQPLGS